MKQLTWAVLTIVGGLVVAEARPALAQAPYVAPPVNPYNPYARPAFSPYLNLGRGGNPAINYYGLVRPQLQFSNSLQQLQQAQLQDAQGLSQLAATGNQGVLTTGVHSSYMNFSHYYGGRITGSANARPATLPPVMQPPAVQPLLNQIVIQR